MKIFRLLLLIFALLITSTMVSCDTHAGVDAPKSIRIEYETLTLRWDDVDGARTYTVCIRSQANELSEITVSKNEYSLESLLPGKYTITVRSESADDTDALSEKIEFVRDSENGLVYELVDGSEYMVSAKGTASGVVEIPATYRMKPVTAIGDKAFLGSSDVEEVELPDTIRSIGAFAFANCSYLKKINLPDGLTALSESAFSGCRAMTGIIKIPIGVKEIPKSAFAYCSSIEEVHMGSNLITIGDNAFTDCSNLKNVVLSDAIISIGGFAFAACSDLPEIRLPEGLEAIGEFAFSKAIILDSIILPNSVKTIGQGAFYYCNKLSAVELGDGINEIGDAAFLDTAIYNESPTNEIYVGNWFVGLKDPAVNSMDIRYGTVGIANNALYANQQILSVELPDSVKYIGKSAFAVSNINSIVIGSGVKSIAEQAFLYCEDLINVILGSYDYADQAMVDSSLEVIGDYAFMNCTSLQRIDIPDTVNDIGAYAFRNTYMFSSALTGAVYADNWIVDFNKTITEEITVDRGTVGIARYAFYNCKELKSIKIDNSVKIIGKGAFYNCTALEKVTLPDTLCRIEDYCFYSCTSLKLTSLPPMLREIGRSAFYLCGTADNYVSDSDNDTLEIPSGVTYIGDFAFFGCGYRRADAINGETETAGIDHIIMGDSIEYIGKCAFRGFSSLKTVTIAGATMIADKAFYECTSLERIVVADNLTKIGKKAFYKCAELKYAEFPDDLLRIEDQAFYKCISLVRVDLGCSLEYIGDLAFYGDILLAEMDVPTTVTYIGQQAFRDCDSLRSFTLSEDLDYVGDHAFYSCDSLTLYAEWDINTSEWSKWWNSSFAAVVWNCELSGDGYVASVIVKGVENKFVDTQLSDPTRCGYTFIGWSTDASSSTAQLTTADICNVAERTQLYAIWVIAEP